MRNRDRRVRAATPWRLLLSLIAVTAVALLSAFTARVSASTTTAPRTTPAAATHDVAGIPAECSQAADFVDLAFQGPSCQAHGKLVVRTRSGYALTVAPPDAIAALKANAAASATAASPAPADAAVDCVNPATTPHVEIYYVHFADQADYLGYHVADLQQQFRDVDANYVDYDSRLYGGPDMHLAVACDGNGSPAIGSIGLSTTLNSTNYSTIVSDLQSQGHTSNLAHYWLWTDGNPTSGYAGQSSVIGDDSPGSTNAINSSSEYSINYGYYDSNGGPGIFAHENGHAMGAVQLSAPDTSGAWHCIDGLDVMCYNDGGSNAGAYTTGDCGSTPNGTSPFDCHRNDYFNPCPAPGSYLSSHWNIASSNNAWLRVSTLSSTTTFDSPPQSVIQGQASWLTVAVAGGGCGGTVTFTNNGTTLGTAPVSSNGLAAISLSSLAKGHYTVSASFGGNSIATPSATSSPAAFDVIPPPFTSLVVAEAYGGLFPVSPSSVAQQGNIVGDPDVRGVALRAGGSSGYVLDGWGGLHPFGGAPYVYDSGYWPGWDITRGIVLRPDGVSGYVLDGWGGIHPFGNAPQVYGTGYWPGWDIARGIVLRSDGVSGYILDGWGGIHPFGGAPQMYGSAYWPGFDIARSITLNPDGAGGYVLDGSGGIHTFGNAVWESGSGWWPGQDIARSIVEAPGTASEGWVLDGFGGIHPFGAAPQVSGTGWWPGWDIARAFGVR